MRGKSSSLAGMGSWTLIGLLALLIWLTFSEGIHYIDILRNIGLLVTGGVELIPSGRDMPLMKKFAEIIAVILINIPVVIILATLFNKSKSYNDAALDAALDKGPLAFFQVITIEEIIARGVLLLVLYNILPGAVWFYILFIVGNIVWGALHFANYKDPTERKVSVILPQLASGIMFTYILVRFGFWAAIMAHFFFDVILLSGRKEKDTLGVNLINLAYYVILGAIVFFIARANGVHIGDVRPWLDGSIEKLEGYSFWGYAALLILVNCLVGIVMNFLMFDTTEKSQETYDAVLKKSWLDFVGHLFGIAAGAALLLLAGNWILSWVITDIAARAVALTIGLSLISTTKSGSAMARATLANLPSVFFLVVSFSVLGFWTTAGLVAVNYISDFLPDYMDSE